MNHRDQALERLVKLYADGQPIPATVNVGGRVEEARRFLESYRFDRRPASPGMMACVSTVERSLMSEVALSLL